MSLASPRPDPGKSRGKWSIPDVYKGIRFRSRLEVTWAKFFDVHHVQWAYEPEGFHIGNVYYLPDFYLPEIKTIVEVKGVLDATDEAKLGALIQPAASQGIMLTMLDSGGAWKLVATRISLP